MYIDYFAEEFHDETMHDNGDDRMVNLSDEKRDGVYADSLKKIMTDERHGQYWLAFIRDNKHGDNEDGMKNMEVRRSNDDEYYVQYFMTLLKGDAAMYADSMTGDTSASDDGTHDIDSNFSRNEINYGLSPVQESRIHLEILIGIKL